VTDFQNHFTDGLGTLSWYTP